MQFKLTTTTLTTLLLTAVAGAATPNGAADTNLARGKLARDYTALAGLDVTSKHRTTPPPPSYTYLLWPSSFFPLCFFCLGGSGGLKFDLTYVVDPVTQIPVCPVMR